MCFCCFGWLCFWVMVVDVDVLLRGMLIVFFLGWEFLVIFKGIGKVYIIIRCVFVSYLW